MLPLGTEAPNFSLPKVTDDTIASLDDFPKAKAYLIAFVCNHCPYVIHLRNHFAKLGNSAWARGAGVFAISSNDVEHYPADSPELMAKEARENDYHFPYLYDETQEVAKAYRAACTPDFFLFDANRRLVYRGQFDDSRPGNGKLVTGFDLQAALDAVVENKPIPQPQIPSLGCNIKWKPGNEPAYLN